MEKMETRLAGQILYSRKGGHCDSLDFAEEFLKMKDKFNIVAAHLPATEVDVNSDWDTIYRNTDDDHNSAVNVVVSVNEFFVSHAPLFDKPRE